MVPYLEVKEHSFNSAYFGMTTAAIRQNKLANIEIGQYQRSSGQSFRTSTQRSKNVKQSPWEMEVFTYRHDLWSTITNQQV